MSLPTASAATAAKAMSIVKLKEGSMVVFDGEVHHWPWYYKKLRGYVMKNADAWAILTGTKVRTIALEAHDKPDFKEYIKSETETKLSNTRYDCANMFIYCAILESLSEACSSFFTDVEEGDGMTVLARLLAKFERQDIPAKMQVAFKLINAKQAPNEPLDAYTNRTKELQTKTKSMKITIDDMLVALYLTGLDSAKYATPRDFLLLQPEVTMDKAETKLRSFQDFHATMSNHTDRKETPKAFPAATDTLTSKRKTRCGFCGFQNHVEAECRKKAAAIKALKSDQNKNKNINSGGNISRGMAASGGAYKNTNDIPGGMAANGLQAKPTIATNPYALDVCNWSLMAQQDNNLIPTSGSFKLFLDNCCSYHIFSGDQQYLTDYRTTGSGYSAPSPVVGAGNHAFQPIGGGWLDGFYFHHCPDLGANLLSQGQLQREGYTVRFDKLNCTITDPLGNLVLATKLNASNIYTLDRKSVV